MMRRRLIPRLILGLSLIGSWMGMSRVLWAEAFVVDPDAYYEVTYQLNEMQSRAVKSVKVAGIVKIGDREWLVIEPTNIPQRARGYIALERVSALLPMQPGGFSILDSAPAQALPQSP